MSRAPSPSGSQDPHKARRRGIGPVALAGAVVVVALVFAVAYVAIWGRPGRSPSATSLVGGMPDGGLAEDFFRAGEDCLKRDRLTLGWAALEAAHRIDPGHEPTNQALDRLQGRIGRAAGVERVRLHRAVERMEFLRASGSAALGMLALGLDRHARTPEQEEEFLDRLVLKDRAVLQSMGTPEAAARLVARLLMETGRPADAAEVLRPLVDRGGGPGRPAAIDREAAWLMSRVGLQLDQHDMADAMLAAAAGFGEDGAASPEPSPYVGSSRCAQCHLSLYRTQQGESRHADTIWLGTRLKEIPLPTEAVVDPVDLRMTHTFARPADDRIELESKVEDRISRAVISYALGSGHRGMTMIGRDPSGADYELRISYYAEGRTWDRTKTSVIATREGGDAIGMEMTPRDMRQCLHCHTTWYRPFDLAQPGPRGPEAEDHGIGCERCHGPGLNHVKAVESGFARMAIAQTPATPPAARLKSCNECHASNGSVPPDSPEFVRVQGTTLTFSRCFTETKGKIDCTTCHDPHRNVEKSGRHYEEKCLACHPSAGAASSPGTTADAAIGRPCPVNPTRRCVACHMPRVEEPVLHTTFTDHHIRIHHEPAASLPSGTSR